jgi:hypothetical protein
MQHVNQLLSGFEVFTPMTVKNAVFWDVTPCRFCELTDVSEERVASIFRVEKSASEEPA